MCAFVGVNRVSILIDENGDSTKTENVDKKGPEKIFSSLEDNFY